MMDPALFTGALQLVALTVGPACPLLKEYKSPHLFALNVGARVHGTAPESDDNCLERGTVKLVPLATPAIPLNGSWKHEPEATWAMSRVRALRC